MAATAKKPTRKQPALGSIGLLGVPITEVEYWVEDSLHHINSLDFGLTVSADSFEEALQKLGESVEDYWDMLEGLSSEERTPRENNILITTRRSLQQVLEVLNKAAEQVKNRHWPNLGAQPSGTILATKRTHKSEKVTAHLRRLTKDRAPKKDTAQYFEYLLFLKMDSA